MADDLRDDVGVDVARVVEADRDAVDLVGVAPLEVEVDLVVDVVDASEVQGPAEGRPVDRAGGADVLGEVTLDGSRVGPAEVGPRVTDELAFDVARDHRAGRGVHGEVGIALAVVRAQPVGGLGQRDAEVPGVVALGDAGRAVRIAVAVVVRAVRADLDAGGADELVGVVAVAGVLDVAVGVGAVLLRGVGVAVAVAVQVGVVGVAGLLVDVPVAVVVLRVAVLGGAGVDRGVGVVAVGRVRHGSRGSRAGRARAGSAVAVGVDVVVPVDRVDAGVGIGDPIAVVVRAIAVLVGAGEARRVAVIAVGGVGDVALRLVALGDRGSRGVAEVVAVGVRVPGAGIGAGAGIDHAVAVVVDVVADLGRAGVHADVGVVAVAHHVDVADRLVAGERAGARVGVLEALAPSVAIGVGVPGQDVEAVVRVGGPVAVVVQAVAYLVGVRADGGVGVIAVTTLLDETVGGAGGERAGVVIAVAVGVIVVPQDQDVGVAVGLVDHAVAVVVQAVADLGRARVDQRVVVVAVAGLGHVVLGCLAGLLGLFSADVVTVAVEVPGRGVRRVLVDGAFAVIVDSVADLLGRGVHAGVGVVAVAGHGDPLARALALEVTPVHDRELTAVAVEVAVVVPGVVLDVVGLARAVVVDAVADLDGAGVDAGVGVVAVAVLDGPSVVVGVRRDRSVGGRAAVLHDGDVGGTRRGAQEGRQEAQGQDRTHGASPG